MSTTGVRRTNLLIVASGLGLGGAETVMRDLAFSLDRRLFNVSVCCLKELGDVGRDLASAGLDIETLAASPREVNYLSFLRLLKLVRRKGIEVVHTHTTDGLVDAVSCKLFMPRLKVIHTFHFGNYPHLDRRIMWMERAASRFADRVLAVGEVQRGQLRRVYGFEEHRIATVRNGVVLGPSRDPGGAFRAKVGTGRRILVGTIATLIEQKGLRDLLRVARLLRDEDQPVQFVIVGEGHLRGELEAKARDLGLGDMVVFTGWVHNAAATALPEFDIFFQPSLWEAMSIAVLEAMGAGKPVVATRVGENPFVIDDGLDGWLVNPGDVDQMAAAIRELTLDLSLRRRLGDSARQKVARLYSVDHMTAAYERVYLETLHREAWLEPVAVA